MATIAEISQAFGNGDSHPHTASVGYVDGQPPKRRGPKPDSKPALTRRQELNRQAQRTHRERKEMYIKALEQEVLRLKETFGEVCRERDAFAEEARKLRELLAANGLSHLLDSIIQNTAAVTNSSGSISGSYGPPSSSSCRTPPPLYGQIGASTQRNNNGGGTNNNSNQRSNAAIDYDSVGIDFVLALERPCMDHMQMLCVKSQESDGDISGHALMATCPPESHLIEHPDVQYPHKMPDMQASDLLKLLDLSNRLPLEGEITPVMAWAFLLKDHRFADLNKKDFITIKTDLLTKVRCYGFGAVLEEFEIKDAIEGVFAAKMDLYTGYAK